MLVGIVDVAGTFLMWLFDDDAPRSQIHNLWDACFFSTVQLLTVSSQMPNPVTTAGGSSTSFSSSLLSVSSPGSLAHSHPSSSTLAPKAKRGSRTET